MSSKHVFQGSSPSSGGAESAAGTPETRLTPFSSVKSVHEKTGFLFNHMSSSPAGFQESSTKVAFEAMDKDPFISTSSRTKYEQSLLSPTASTFQPFALRISQKPNHTPMVAKSPGPRGATSINEYATDSKGDIQSSPATQSGTFSTDLGIYTRALKVSGDHHPIQLSAVESCVQEANKQSNNKISFARSGSDVLMRFLDINDAIDVYKYLQIVHPEWSIEFIAPAVFAQKTNTTLPPVSAHEGQIGLVANFPPSGGFDRAKLEGIILDLLSIDGTVYAYQKQLATEAGTFRLIAEYGDVEAAARAVERLNGATVRGINISIAFHKPDINNSPRPRGYPSTPTRGAPNSREPASLTRLPMMNAMDLSMTPDVFASVLSPTGRSFVPTAYTISPQYSALPMLFGGQFSPVNPAIGGCTPPLAHYPPDYSICSFGTGGPIHHGFVPQAGNWGGFNSPVQAPRDAPLLRFSARRQSGPRGGNRSSYPNSQVGQHNVVDMDRIRAGLDVRTTIMLRNIPNKIDQGQLKAIIDQTSRGLYDFMYLRIDFANNCNVGYAFINFEDPYHIINFVAARAGQRWNRYGSDKIAEVSYATIQGKDCLVQKFRNSSVMLEHPSYRPKIFYTGSHPRAGDEEDFPLPDNASKMRRSVENAEHVGLFAPRAGQHYRDEQRRRRSRYDRGTPLAALEEYDYEELYTSEQDLQVQYAYERTFSP